MSPTPVTAYFPTTTALTARETGTVVTHLEWRTTDPLAVRLTIRNGADKPVTWIFGRDLLADGVTSHNGDGDVTVGPVLADDPDTGQIVEDPHHIEVTLRSPKGVGGSIALIFQTVGINLFLHRTYQRVDRGQEHYPIDLRDLFGRREAA